MYICKKTGMKKECNAEFCRIVFSGRGMSAAALTSLFTERVYAVVGSYRSVFSEWNYHPEE
jgi:hypothetical protein